MAGAPSGGSSGAGGAAGSGGTATGGGGSGGQAGAAGGSGPRPACTAPTTYRNLFTSVLSKSADEVNAKLMAGYESLFHGGNNNQVYYTAGSDEAYILDVNSNDVRSEGMSYGMMIAVQLDKQEEFNRLWKWARRVMYHSSGNLQGYFAWKASPQGTVLEPYSAPDGEEYFATALIFAAKRWGDGSGVFAYSTEARNLLNAMVNRGLFNRGNYLVTFGPEGASATYTDPSYVLPAFYEVWACYDNTNRAFWQNAIRAGRTFFQRTTHAQTGLAPYKANFDGSPRPGEGDFNSDSWRVVGNIMMDHNLFAADPWQTTFAARYAAFFKTAMAQRPVPDEFTISGQVLHTNADPAKGLVAQNALVAFGVPAADGAPFLQALWDMEVPTGQYRYYDGMLYLLAFLHASGQFHLWF